MAHLTSSTTSKRNANNNNNNKDTTTPVKHVEATMMTPLTDIYDVYSRYGFHPPSCPALPFEEFHDLLRTPSEPTMTTTATTTATAREPVWNQPTTGFVLRHDIPLDLLRPTIESTSTIPLPSPQPGKLENTHSALPRGDTTSSSVLVQASFRYPPDEWIDPEPYLALTPTPPPATAPSDGTTDSGPAAAAASTPTPAAAPVTKCKHFKEHDLVWRSVGLNFARWVKSERGKRMAAKVEMVVAGDLEGERERERKRQRLEYAEQQGRQGGPVPVPVSMPMNGGRQGAQASVFVRPAQVATAEERRRVIMSRWYVPPVH
ncbi:hypothetical protein QFC22_006063 [Naganishia vaughanmartiniae]|uniref:Uncharacterized protein n=1 Tax=Naganishia vaughanmartiniae TaxID=1424756 RepID=A0ACC2WPT8_9TREE|nr:hypothetical protein QFC22_006063 [Naganishia vaughanmartiniae]